MTAAAFFFLLLHLAAERQRSTGTGAGHLAAPLPRSRSSTCSHQPGTLLRRRCCVGTPARRCRTRLPVQCCARSIGKGPLSDVGREEGRLAAGHQECILRRECIHALRWPAQASGRRGSWCASRSRFAFRAQHPAAACRRWAARRCSPAFRRASHPDPFGSEKGGLGGGARVPQLHPVGRSGVWRRGQKARNPRTRVVFRARGRDVSGRGVLRDREALR